jgi:hypothetical protein
MNQYTMSSLIFCCNCIGLNDSIKRRDVLNFFQTKEADTLCARNPFCKRYKKENVFWVNAFGYFSHGKSNAKGAAILFRKSLDIKINSVRTDDILLYRYCLSLQFLY